MYVCICSGTSGLQNYKHIVINNGVHDSVGGQPTVGFDINIPSIAQASGYKWTASASTPEDIAAKLQELRNAEGPALLQIVVKGGARKNLGRPTSTPCDNKIQFMKFLEQ